MTQYGLETLDHAALKNDYGKAISRGRPEPPAACDEAELLTGLELCENGKLTFSGYG